MNKLIEALKNKAVSAPYVGTYKHGYVAAIEDVIKDIENLREWQPIETAPMNEAVLILDNDFIDPAVARFDGTHWEIETNREFYVVNPRAWRPL